MNFENLQDIINSDNYKVQQLGLKVQTFNNYYKQNRITYHEYKTLINNLDNYANFADTMEEKILLKKSIEFIKTNNAFS